MVDIVRKHELHDERPACVLRIVEFPHRQNKKKEKNKEFSLPDSKSHHPIYISNNDFLDLGTDTFRREVTC